MKPPLPSGLLQAIAVVAIGITICIGATWLINTKHEQSRVAFLKSTTEVTSLLTDGLENQLLLAFKISELALSRLANDWIASDICEGGPSEAPILKSIAAEYDVEGILTVFDASGWALCSSLNVPPSGLWVTDRDYFKAVIEASPNSIVFGAPIIGRITGEWSLPIVRRISDADGSDLTGCFWTRLIEIISLERKPEDAEEATHR